MGLEPTIFATGKQRLTIRPRCPIDQKFALRFLIFYLTHVDQIILHLIGSDGRLAWYMRFRLLLVCDCILGIH